MIWSATGNYWLDGWIRHVMNFESELDSPACSRAPLDSKDREDLRKCVEKLNKINQRIRKRIDNANSK